MRLAFALGRLPFLIGLPAALVVAVGVDFIQLGKSLALSAVAVAVHTH